MPGLYERMKAREYLDFYGRLYGLSEASRRERADTLMARLGMTRTMEQRIGTYSKGMKQKLAIVRAMLHDPLVLLLDEPTSAMDPHSARLVRDGIAALRHERRAIVVCTHNLTEAEALADRIAIIRQGRIIALGTSTELKRRMLGAPLMELRLAHAVDGLTRDLGEVVQVEGVGEDWVRYRTASPRDSNPRLLRWLAERGQDVVTLSPVPQSLEEVYLRVVEDGEGELVYE